MFKLALYVAIAVLLAPSVAGAEVMDINRVTLAGEGGLFGSDLTTGARVAAQVDFGKYTFEEIGRIHGGPYGLRIDEDSEFGKLSMIGSVGCVPYAGLDFDLNSDYGAGAWLRPGVKLYVPIGRTLLELNAAGLVRLAGGGSSGGQFEALYYFGAAGLFLTSVVQLLSTDSLEVAGVGWAF